MFSTDQYRSDFITGLRQLADYLDAHPDVPVPLYGTDIAYHAALLEDGGRQQVDQIAAAIGMEIDPGSGNYKTMRRCFGPVSYYAVSISDADMARHDALSSYWGCVEPGTDTAGA